MKRHQEIERSIIKKYRKQLWNPFTKAIKEFELIKPGDKIAVCISGGKDSMLLAKLLEELQRHGKVPFELVYLSMDPGYSAQTRELIQKNTEILNIKLNLFQSDIFDITDQITNPCYLCARMRRGHLYNEARNLGCNKIALGHHFNDVIETTLMSIIYGGQIQTMMPKLHSSNYPGMELIRPLYRVKEEDIIAWAKHNQLEFIQCACRLTEKALYDENSSMRKQIKELIKKLKNQNQFVEANIYKSTYNVNLNQIIGYKKDGKLFNFLDEYEEENDESIDKGQICPKIND